MPQGFNVGNLFWSLSVDSDQLRKDQNVLSNFTNQIKNELERKLGKEAADNISKNFKIKIEEGTKDGANSFIKIMYKANKDVSADTAETWRRAFDEVVKTLGTKLGATTTKVGSEFKNVAIDFNNLVKKNLTPLKTITEEQLKQVKISKDLQDSVNQRIEAQKKYQESLKSVNDLIDRNSTQLKKIKEEDLTRVKISDDLKKQVEQQTKQQKEQQKSLEQVNSLIRKNITPLKQIQDSELKRVKISDDLKKSIQERQKALQNEAKLLEQNRLTAFKNIFKPISESQQQLTFQQRLGNFFNPTQVKGFNSALNETYFNVNSLIYSFSRLGYFIGVSFSFQRMIEEVKQFTIETDRGLREIAAITELTNEQLTAYRKNFMDFMKESPFAVNELLEALRLIVSAGVEAEASYTFLEKAQTLALFGATDLRTAVDTLTTVLDAWGLTTTDLNSVLDTLFVGIQDGKQTIDEFAASLGKVATNAGAVGLSFDDTTAAISALTRVGLSARTASTGLSRAIEQIIKPTDQAKTLTNLLGIEFSETALRAKGLNQFFADLGQSLNDSREDLQTLGLTTSEVIRTLFNRIQASRVAFALLTSAINVYNETLEDMNDKQGKAEEAAKRMELSLESARIQMQNKFKASFENTTPIIENFLRAFYDIVNNISAFNESLDGSVKVIGALSVALGFVLPLIGQISKLLTSIPKGLGWTSLILIAVPAAITFIGSLINKTDEAVDTQKLFTDSLRETQKQIENMLDDLNLVSDINSNISSRTREVTEAFFNLTQEVTKFNKESALGSENISTIEKSIQSILKDYPQLSLAVEKQNGQYTIQQDKIKEIIALEKRRIDLQIQQAEATQQSIKSQLKQFEDFNKTVLGEKKETQQGIVFTGVEKIKSDVETLNKLYLDYSDSLKPIFDSQKKGLEKTSKEIVNESTNILTLPKTPTFLDSTDKILKSIEKEYENSIKPLSELRTEFLKSLTEEQQKEIFGIEKTAEEKLQKHILELRNIAKEYEITLPPIIDSQNFQEVFQDLSKQITSKANVLQGLQNSYTELSFTFEQNKLDIEKNKIIASNLEDALTSLFTNIDNLDSEFQSLNNLFKKADTATREDIVKKFGTSLNKFYEQILEAQDKVILDETGTRKVIKADDIRKQASQNFKRVLEDAPDIVEYISQIAGLAELFPEGAVKDTYNVNEIKRITEVLSGFSKISQESTTSTLNVLNEALKLQQNINSLNKIQEKTVQQYDEAVSDYEKLISLIQKNPEIFKSKVSELTDTERRIFTQLNTNVEVLTENYKEALTERFTRALEIGGVKPSTTTQNEILNTIFAIQEDISKITGETSIEELRSIRDKILQVSEQAKSVSPEIGQITEQALKSSQEAVQESIQDFINNYTKLTKEALRAQIESPEISVENISLLFDDLNNYINKLTLETGKLTDPAKISENLALLSSAQQLKDFAKGLVEGIDFESLTVNQREQLLNLYDKLNIDTTNLKESVITALIEYRKTVTDPNLYSQITDQIINLIATNQEIKDLIGVGELEQAQKLLQRIESERKKAEISQTKLKITQIETAGITQDLGVSTELAQTQQLKNLYQDLVQLGVSLSQEEKASLQALEERIVLLKEKLDIEEVQNKLIELNTKRTLLTEQIAKNEEDINVKQYAQEKLISNLNSIYQTYLTLLASGVELTEEQRQDYESLLSIVDELTAEQQTDKLLDSLKKLQEAREGLGKFEKLELTFDIKGELESSVAILENQIENLKEQKTVLEKIKEVNKENTEEYKNADEQLKIINSEIDTSTNKYNLAKDQLEKLNNLFSKLGDTIAKGLSFGDKNLEKVISSVFDLGKALAKGDWVSGIQATIQLVSSAIQGFTEATFDEVYDKLKDIQDKLQAETSRTTKTALKRDLEKFDKEFEETISDLKAKKRDLENDFWANLDVLNVFGAKGRRDDAVKAVEQEMKALEKEYSERRARIFAETIGITADSITQAISDAFSASNYIEFQEEFTKNLNELLIEAITSAFIQSFLNEQVIDKFIQDFNELYTRKGENFTEQDLQELIDGLGLESERLKAFFEARKKLLETVQQQQGEIINEAQRAVGTALTEETANQLVGVFYTIMENVQMINRKMVGSISYDFTSFGDMLNNIDGNIFQIKNILQTGVLKVEVVKSQTPFWIDGFDDNRSAGNLGGI